MIAFNIFLLELAGSTFAATHALKLFFKKGISSFHKIIAVNAGIINLTFVLINSLWQMSGSNSTQNYNVYKLEYWLWTFWELHIIAL